jgi:hypothetical protein
MLASVSGEPALLWVEADPGSLVLGWVVEGRVMA